MDNFDPSQFAEYFREVFEFRTSLNAETDRGCALMVASFLDHKLQDLLTALFVDDPKVVSALFDQSGPLGTFSARIDTSYALGLIGPKVRRDIHLIRKIRNEFGHSHHILTFNDERIRNRCNELFHFKNIEGTDDPRKMFIGTIMSILAVINSDLRNTEHLSPGKDLYCDQSEQQQVRKQIQDLATSLDESTKQSLEQLLNLLNKTPNQGK